jgi:hypothetical protein
MTSGKLKFTFLIIISLWQTCNGTRLVSTTKLVISHLITYCKNLWMPSRQWKFSKHTLKNKIEEHGDGLFNP